MASVAQMAVAPVCDTGGRRFESCHSPSIFSCGLRGRGPARSGRCAVDAEIMGSNPIGLANPERKEVIH